MDAGISYGYLSLSRMEVFHHDRLWFSISTRATTKRHLPQPSVLPRQYAQWFPGVHPIAPRISGPGFQRPRPHNTGQEGQLSPVPCADSCPRLGRRYSLNGVQILASKCPRMQNTRLIHRPRRSIIHLINTPPMILPEEASARYTSLLFGRSGVVWFFPFCGSFPSPMEDEPVLSEATRLDSR